jgi:hypothetical protein
MKNNFFNTIQLYVDLLLKFEQSPTMSEDQTTTAEDSARINPTNEATFRALKTITSKCIQCEHHIEILENHVIKGTTPKGLTCTIQPNTPWTDSDFIVQWEKIKLDFHSKLLVALCEYWRRYKSKLQKEQTKLEKNLKANSTEPEWIKMQETLDKVLVAIKERYNKKKTSQPPRGGTYKQPRNQNGEDRRRTLRRPGNKNQTQNQSPPN